MFEKFLIALRFVVYLCMHIRRKTKCQNVRHNYAINVRFFTSKIKFLQIPRTFTNSIHLHCPRIVSIYVRQVGTDTLSHKRESNDQNVATNMLHFATLFLEFATIPLLI